MRAAVAGLLVAPDLRLVVRAIRDLFVQRNLAPPLAQELGEMRTAGHHAFEARSVLGAVKARRVAPPA